MEIHCLGEIRLMMACLHWMWFSDDVGRKVSDLLLSHVVASVLVF